MTNETANLLESKLIKSQKKTHVVDGFRIDGGAGTLKIHIRYDDQLRNGHNTFAITADLYRDDRHYTGGCIHDDIKQFAPQFAPLIKWHLCNSDGPCGYLANALYFADEHDANKAWIRGHIEENGIKQSVTKYGDVVEMQEIVDSFEPGRFEMNLDEKTAKVANLEGARSSAIWEDATIEQLRDKDQLEARLPALVDEFKAVIESLGYTY